MKAFSRALLILLLLGAAAPGRAAFEDLGAGARAPGMGNAFTSLADDAYAVYYNPSGLAQLERPQFSAAYSKLYTGLSDNSDLGLSQMAYAHPLKGGKEGTLGAGWQRFSLSGLYTEQTMLLSYGRTVWERDSGSKLLAGTNLKYLSHSFARTPEAENACSGINCNQGVDPVLSGSNSKGAADADLGLLYRFPRRFQLGLMAQHVMRPDVGFASSDRLPMNLRTGLSYKSLWMNLAGELRFEPAPDGSTDKDFILAVERYFPTLEFGQFGLRGSLGFGSREWRQITTGLSYRINKIQFDYGFLMPIGSFKDAGGTHRVALTLHFGAPAPEEQASRDLLEQSRKARDGKTPGYGYEFAEVQRPHDLNDPRLADVRRMINEGQFRKAQRALVDLAKDLPADGTLARLATRLDITAYPYPDYPIPDERWEVVLSSAIRAYLEGRDRSAIMQASYAFSLNSSDAKLDQFLSKLESDTGIRADRLAADAPRSFIDELLHRVEAAHNRRDLPKVEQLLRDIQELEPGNVTALERTGSYYFILGKYRQAISSWERALPLEKKQTEIDSLNEFIRQAKEKLTGPALPGDVQPLPPPEPEPAEPPAPKPVRRAAPPPLPSGGDARDIPQLYQKGVEHYARGEYLQATAVFMRILQIDPNNAQARKALDRIERQGK